MAFIADCKMVANYWQRSGDACTSNNIKSFLDDTFEKLGNKRIGLFRAVSGLYVKKVFNYLQSKQINYIIAARMYEPIQNAIASHRTCLRMTDGLEIGETQYKSPHLAK